MLKLKVEERIQQSISRNAQEPNNGVNYPIVSIIIPCHNYGRYVGDAIQSALNQTYSRKEIIVIDDESTDDTPSVAQKFPVRYLRIKHKGKRTPAYACNKGIELSTGGYIVVMGADDKLAPTYIEACLERYLSAPNTQKVAFIWTGYRSFGSKNKTVLPNVPKLSRFNCDHPGGQLGGMLVPRAAYSEVGLYDTSLSGLEDWDWAIRAIKNGFIGLSIPHALYLYRMHGQSLNASAITNNVVKELYEKYPLFSFQHRVFYYLYRIRFCLPHPTSLKRLIFNELTSAVAGQIKRFL